MYGQGNCAPQFRHGPPATPPPPPYQQGPPLPPPTYQQGPPVPPLTYQQGPPAPIPTYQQVPSAPPPPYHHGSPAPPVYQQSSPTLSAPSFHHGPPAPRPLVHPGHSQQVHGPPGTMNTGQPYLHPPPLAHGSAPLGQSYTTPHQTPQYPSSTGTQNFHHVNPPVPPASGPSLMGPTPPPRVLPPPIPSPGQMLYRTTTPLPSHGTMQGLQPIRPLSPPPPSGLVPVTPTPFASFSQASYCGAHPPSMPPPPPPPPPPSSPPPLPPSPPPPSSPPADNSPLGVSKASSVVPLDHASGMSHHSRTNLDTAEKNITPVDDGVGPTKLTGDVSTGPGGCTHSEIDISCEMDSVVADGVAPKGQSLVDLPSTPQKPADEEIVRNIEVLCQFIAKVGPDFENLARTKEAGNPKFAFLFGGEPGSAAALGHEYFQWMKKKCHLELKGNVPEQSDPALHSSGIGSSLQSINSMDDGDGLSISPAVSDMDVEDDMDQSDKEEDTCQTMEISKVDPALVCDVELDLKGQVHATQCSTKPLKSEDVSGSISCSRSSPLVPGQGKEKDNFTSARPHTEDLCLVSKSSKAIECIFDSNKASNKQTTDDAYPVEASSPAVGDNSEEVPKVFIKDGSPFKLIQDYASDDSSEDDKETCLEDVSPIRVSPNVSEDTSCLNKDESKNMDSDLGVKNISTAEIGSTVASEMTKAAKIPDSTMLPNKVASPPGIVQVLLDAVTETDKPSILDDDNQVMIGRMESSVHVSDALQASDSDIDPQIEKVHREVDVKEASAALNVDEFGRLVRKGGSDSDSDGMRYAGRRSKKRGRSWSRSPSPQEGRWRRRSRSRSRSPWRRRDKRSRSRSRSPRKYSNRSKSPTSFRRVGEFGNERMRRDNRVQPECFNFLKGRCYRGASCRFLHRDSALGDARRWNRDRQEAYQEIQRDTRETTLHKVTHDVGETHEPKKSMGVELTSDRHDLWPEEGKFLNVQTGLDASISSDEAPKNEYLYEKKGLDSAKDEFGQSGDTTAAEEFSHSQDSKGGPDQIEEPQEDQQVQQVSSVPCLEKEDSPRPVESQETCQPPPADLSNKPEPVAETHHSPGDAPGQSDTDQKVVPQPPEPNVSDSLPVAEHQNVPTHPLHVEGSFISHPIQVQKFPSSSFSNLPPQSQPYLNQVPATQTYPDKIPFGLNQVSGSQPVTAEDFRTPPFAQPPTFSGGDFQLQSSQLPHPPQLHPPTSFPQDNLNAPHASHTPRDYHLQPPGANIWPQPVPAERYPHYRPPLVDYHSQQAPPPSHSWAGHPPFPNESAPRPAIPNSDFHPLQFQHNPMLSRNDLPLPLSRPFSADIPPHSRTFPSMETAHQPTMDNLRDHQYGGSSFMRENRFMHPTIPEDSQLNHGHPNDYHLHPLPSFREEFSGPLSGRENAGGFQQLQDPRFGSKHTMHSQHPPFPGEHSQVRSFPVDSLPPRDFSHSQIHQSSYGSQLPSNVDPSLSRYPQSFPGSNQPSHLSDAAGLKASTSTHYNPFASTFEQTPASLKSNSSVFDTKYISKYDSPFRLSHGPVGGPGSGGPGARHVASSPDSGRPGRQFFPRSGRELATGDEYDPLFDSIEPSSNMFRKSDHAHNSSALEAVSGSIIGRVNETGIGLRLSSLHGPPDVEDKRKESMADEFDGTAIDAEVGTVENASPQLEEGKNWSPTDPIDLINTAAGEIEIDQIKSPGKSKKGKDSRSMKLFKIAIADFVKEVLKPSWRQGNMSKEAFKTIVKKTVDKVSGAMQSHQIPKSQAKINQYVESSQRKLTKLVMGYVDKYTKV